MKVSDLIRLLTVYAPSDAEVLINGQKIENTGFSLDTEGNKDSIVFSANNEYVDFRNTSN